jgi:hypothetical protein
MRSDHGHGFAPVEGGPDMAAAKNPLFWGVAADVWAAAVVALCASAVCHPAMAEPTSNTQGQIIWNDAQAPGAAQNGIPASNAPIRDTFTSSPAPGSAGGATPSRGENSIIWDQPPVRSASPARLPLNRDTASAAGPCREFQQQVIIDGRPQRGHGRACLQPDGSWRIVN